jgi:hypothetical protein
MDDPRDRHPVLGLRIVDRMPADDRDARLGGRLRAPLEDLGEDRGTVALK